MTRTLLRPVLSPVLGQVLHPADVPVDRTLGGILAGLGYSPAFVVDAGDRNSFNGGQTWDDTSANALQFNRGATNSADTDDPQFTGEVGRLSSGEYFGFDGGDFLSLATANPTLLAGLHKDNADWWMMAVIWTPNLTTNNYVMATPDAGSGGIGLRITLNSGDKLRLQQVNGTTVESVHTTTAEVAASSWNLIGLRVDEAGGASASRAYINGTTETFNGAFTSPSATDADNPLRLGAMGDNSSPFESGVRLAGAALGAGDMDFDALARRVAGRWAITL